MAAPAGSRDRSLLDLLVWHRRDPLDLVRGSLREDGGVSVFRLGPQRVVAVGEPELIHEVLVRRTNEFRKAHQFERDLPWAKAILGDGLLMSDGETWLRHRRMMQPAFHRAEVAGYAGVITAETSRLIQEWTPGTARDVYRDMGRLTLRILGVTIFGVGELADELYEGFQDLFEDRQATRGLAHLLPEWLPTPANRRSRKGLRTIERLIAEAIRSRRALSDRPRDLLTRLIEARDADGSAFTDRQVRDEIMSTTVAGHDTLAATLAYALDVLARHPAVQDRLAHDRAGLLDQVVKEVLRLYPPGKNTIRVAVSDVDLAGRPVPRGTFVILSQWAVHRDERWFEAPDEFRPERWTPEFELGLPRLAVFPFGAGPRLCLGAPVAELALRLALATILQRFSLRPDPDPARTSWDPATLRPRRGLWLVTEPRSATAGQTESGADAAPRVAERP